MSKSIELVPSAVEHALFTRRRANSRFTTAGLIHHSNAWSQVGFKWCRNTPECGGVKWVELPVG